MTVIKLAEKKHKTFRDCVLELLDILEEQGEEPMDTVILLGLPTDKALSPIVSQYIGRKGVDSLLGVGLLAYAKNTMLNGDLEFAEEEDYD